VSLVCVVAEDRALLGLLGRALRDAGFAVDAFSSPGPMFQALGQRRYDLVLLDATHRERDGATLDALRTRAPTTLVVVLAGSTDSAYRVRCLDAGACDVVGKPFDLSELLARTRAHLRRLDTPAPSSYLNGGQGRLDMLRRELVLPDRKVTLPPREFLLLRHLMGKAGQVCTRQELLKEVWGYDFEAGTNVVDKYVSRLRRKLPAELIETVRHVGYSYTATSSMPARPAAMTVA
jgi:DNA-binding response OmpR family regulator